MEDMAFGRTRSGQILEETIKHDKRLARKCRSFYHVSCIILNELKRSKIDPSVKYSLRLAYVEQRQRQIDDDLDFKKYDSSFVADIKQRLKYVIRFHANN